MSMKVVAGVSLGCLGVIVLVCAVSGWWMYSAATATFVEAREGLVTQIDGPAEPSGRRGRKGISVQCPSRSVVGHSGDRRPKAGGSSSRSRSFGA